MSIYVRNTIKEFQRHLGVIQDGAWGGVSQEVLEKNSCRISLKPEYIEELLDKANYSKIIRDNRRRSIMTILDTCNDMEFGAAKNKSAKNPLFVAYILATVLHETAYTMYPISEYGKGKTRVYGKVFTNSKGFKYGIKNSRREAYDYSKYPHLYYGRGLVQLTWFDNYEAMSKICGVDLLNNPEEANNPKYASRILVYGMIKGSFTGRSLSSYIKYGLNQDEFINARRIINGTDKARDISNHVYKFIDNMILVG